jgi:hypothetical protein
MQVWAFATTPLREVVEQGFVEEAARFEAGLDDVAGELPVSLELHPMAGKALARAGLSRLAADCGAFAADENARALPRLVGANPNLTHTGVVVVVVRTRCTALRGVLVGETYNPQQDIFGFPAVESSRASPPHRLRWDGLAHRADASRTNLAPALGLLDSPSWNPV